jgi:signal transduction histidine kinase
MQAIAHGMNGITRNSSKSFAAIKWYLERLPSIHRSLQVLAIALLALIFGGTVAQMAHLRRAIIVDMERQTARLDMVLAAQTGHAVETADFILRNEIDTWQARRGAASPGRSDAFDPVLQRRVAGLHQLAGIVLTDASGAVVEASTPELAGIHPDLASEVLALNTTNLDPAIGIGKPQRLADGGWVVALTRRISGPDGGFAGIARAYLNLTYFDDFFQTVELSESSAVMLRSVDGTVLSLYPLTRSVVGSRFPNLSLTEDALAHDGVRMGILVSQIDGLRRVAAVRALKTYPLVISVSVALDTVLAGWRRQVLVLALAGASAGAVVGGLMFLLARRTREMAELLGEFRRACDDTDRANRQLREQMGERERAEAALHKAQRIEAVGQITGGVAHDFNNLLTVVLGNVDLVFRSSKLDPALAERLEAVRAAAERGATLTSQLLAFARRQPLVPRSVDLNIVVDSMKRLMHSALGDSIEIETRLGARLWPAMVDPTQIELVILNLAINARDAMPGGGYLTIETANTSLGAPRRIEDPPAGDYITITVRDTGLGMTPDVLAKAFEPFFTTKRVGAGTGLGLSQVYGTARQSGGGVSIESEPGAGTTVTLHLPRALQAAVPVVETVADSPHRTSRTEVLVVDDDAAVRTTTAEILDDIGFRVRIAEDGPAALDMLRRGATVDVLLCDVAMPGMGGAVLAREARLLRPGLPIIFISGYADPESLEYDIQLTRLVRKPFRRHQLTEEIEAALAG